MNVLPPEKRSAQMPGQCATYGLKYHARNIASLSNQNGSNNRWLTATSALNEENEVILLDHRARYAALRALAELSEPKLLPNRSSSWSWTVDQSNLSVKEHTLTSMRSGRWLVTPQTLQCSVQALTQVILALL